MSIDLWKVSTLALAGALAFTTLGREAIADPPQPHMQNALTALRTAKEQLKKATTDKGGHRVQAINHVDKAMEQVARGIAYDVNHKGDKKLVETEREELEAKDQTEVE